MNQAHRNILREKRSHIVENIADLAIIVDRLQESNILSVSMAQEIMQSEKTEMNKVRKLLDILPKRGPSAFSVFCNVLIATRHGELAVELDPSLASCVTVHPVPQYSRGYSQEGPPPPAFRPPRQVPIPVYTGNGCNDPYSATTSVSSYHSENPSSKAGNQSSIQPGSGGEPSSSSSAKPSPGKQSEQPSSKVPLDRHPSRDVTNTVTAPSDETEVEEDFPEDWPNSIDRSPMSKKDFTMKKCGSEDLSAAGDLNVYPMKKFRRGRALIINIVQYEDENIEERSLSTNDTTRLSELFKSLSFQPVLKTDLTSKDLKKFLHGEASLQYDRYQCFVLVILAYGGEGTVVCKDGKEVEIQQIMDFFSESNCPSLEGKPKLFFIQACGRKMKDIQFASLSGEMESTPEDLTRSMINGMRRLSLSDEVGYDDTDTAPDDFKSTDMRDVFVAIATAPDFVDEHRQYSSTFVLALAYVFCRCAWKDDLIKMMKKINRLKKDPATKDKQGYVQLAEWRSSLVKKLYFFPGVTVREQQDPSKSSELGSTNPASLSSM